MSTKIIAVAAAFTLLGVACTGVSAPSTNAAAAKATAAQAAPEANAAPTAADSPVPASTAETAAPAAKPVETAPAGTAAEPASEAKPAAAEAAAIPPVAKPATAAAPAAPAAKSATLTREQALALAQRGNCLACHKIESKVVGPAWKDVAAKYRGDANAVATITSHIKSGGSFGWKFGTMPPRGGSKISDAEVASLAKFIASLK